MPERVVHAFIRKNRLDHQQVQDVIAGVAADQKVTTDRVVMREVSAAIVLAYFAMHPGAQPPSWEGEFAATDYGYEIVVLDDEEPHGAPA